MADERVVVVTGASRGLGAALAQVAVERGLGVGACSRSTPAVQPSDRVVLGTFDIADGPAVEAFGGEVMATLGRIDVWINNAGLLAPIGKLADVDPVEFQELVDANVMGVFHGSATFARLAREQSGPATLLNISSGAARGAYEGWSAYCASKAAVDRMSECIALEEPALRVYAVAPGIIETGMQELIRQQTEATFPDVDKFKQLHADGALTQATDAARRLLDLALSPAADGPDEVCLDLRD